MGRMVLRTDLKLDESLYLYSSEQEVLLKVEVKGDLVCEVYPYKAFISIFLLPLYRPNVSDCYSDF